MLPSKNALNAGLSIFGVRFSSFSCPARLRHQAGIPYSFFPFASLAPVLHRTSSPASNHRNSVAELIRSHLMNSS